jgi:hypothetical protein
MWGSIKALRLNASKPTARDVWRPPLTTITFELPDNQLTDLRVKAQAWKISLEEVVQEAVSHFLLSDESNLEPVELTPEELKAYHQAQDDFANGRTYSHEVVMAEMKALRAE